MCYKEWYYKIRQELPSGFSLDDTNLYDLYIKQVSPEDVIKIIGG